MMTLEEIERRVLALEQNVLNLATRQSNRDSNNESAIGSTNSEVSNLNAEITETTEVTDIAFVTLAEDGSIDDVTCGEHINVFAEWQPDQNYVVGNIRRYEDKLYRCIMAHTSNLTLAPNLMNYGWVNISDPAIEYPDWSQPLGYADAYSIGDKVAYNGKNWVSNCNGNTWAPGVYGWDEVTE